MFSEDQQHCLFSSEEQLLQLKKPQTYFPFLTGKCLKMEVKAAHPDPPMQSVSCYGGLCRQTQHHFSKFLIKKQLNAPGQLEMQIKIVWFTDIGDSFLPAWARSSHLLRWGELTAKTLKVSYRHLKTS